MAGEMAALIGRNIRIARTAHPERYNQRQLAEELRRRDPQRAASNTAVSEWERGVRKPEDHYMKLISEVLNQPIDWFMRDHGKPEETPELFAVPEEDEDEDQLNRIEKTLSERLAALEAEARGLREEAEMLRAEIALRATGVTGLLQSLQEQVAQVQRWQRPGEPS